MGSYFVCGVYSCCIWFCKDSELVAHKCFGEVADMAKA